VAVETVSAEDLAAQRQFEIERNRFVYEDIFFAKNKYQLDAQARDLLDWKAAWLQGHPQVKVIIEGHCAEGGRAENNMALGLRRAGEVKGYLLRKGVARDRLTAISYGAENPIARGEGEEVQAKNRRVRLVIVED
jgi:peptidoglycan-associated lipoprotein